MDAPAGPFDNIYLLPLGQFPRTKYHRNMARGWESKSVEDQVASHAEQPTNTTTPNNKQQDDAAKKRARQDLELQRERILSQRTSSPVRRAALEAALTEIEARLRNLG